MRCGYRLTREADELLEVAWDKIGAIGAEDWVPAEHYEEAVESSRQAFALLTFEGDEGADRGTLAFRYYGRGGLLVMHHGRRFTRYSAGLDQHSEMD